MELFPNIPSLNEAIDQEQWNAEQEVLRKQREVSKVQYQCLPFYPILGIKL
jgi:hypothetical protein